MIKVNIKGHLHSIHVDAPHDQDEAWGVIDSEGRFDLRGIKIDEVTFSYDHYVRYNFIPKLFEKIDTIEVLARDICETLPGTHSKYDYLSSSSKAYYRDWALSIIERRNKL